MVKIADPKDIMNYLINSNNYKSYLELGVQNGITFRAVNCKHKIGVDIKKLVPCVTFEESTDDFFKHNTEKFDLIFIDALHHYDQVIIDVENAFKILNKAGTIVIHDILPSDEKEQFRVEDRITKRWTGDVWKAWVHYRQENKDITMNCVDLFPGYGIIQEGTQTLLKHNVSLEKLDWDYFKNNVNTFNVINSEEFKIIYA